MKTLRSILKWIALAAPVIVLGYGSPETEPVSAQQPPAEEGQQVLTRGPIHEAFAEPVNFNPKAGFVAVKEPPAAIEEVPPDQKPDGENVAWMPGYWTWEDDKGEFIWVSGFWRTLPPHRQWVSGYWAKSDNGFQWTSGYWASVQTKQVEYLPAPPQSVEAGPSTSAPSVDHIWVPGSWTWYNLHYVWRPGYWIVVQPEWVWMPAHYVWSPCGYVFVDGYWDHAVRSRGVLFAPCYFSVAYYSRPAFYYSPAIVIDAEIVTDHFFCRPVYCHYYFGDYYAPTYATVGILPWFQITYSRGYYCPLYTYERWYYRSDPHWEVNIQLNFNHRVEFADQRPPRTYIAQQTVINNITVNKTVNNNTTINNVTVNKLAMAKPLSQVAASANQNQNSAMKFAKVDQAQRQEITKQAKEAQQSRVERVKLETDPAIKAKSPLVAGANAKPLTMNMPKNTVAAKAATNTGGAAGGAGSKAVSSTPPPPPKPNNDPHPVHSQGTQSSKTGSDHSSSTGTTGTANNASKTGGTGSTGSTGNSSSSGTQTGQGSTGTPGKPGTPPMPPMGGAKPPMPPPPGASKPPPPKPQKDKDQHDKNH